MQKTFNNVLTKIIKMIGAIMIEQLHIFIAVDYFENTFIL